MIRWSLKIIFRTLVFLMCSKNKHTVSVLCLCQTVF